jgi:hypothetical protein
MEKRSGSTFVLSDCLQSGVIAMLTIGIQRSVTVGYMVEALNFIQNQAGAVPPKVAIENERSDEIGLMDVIGRVRLLSRIYESKGRKPVTKKPTSNLAENPQ